MKPEQRENKASDAHACPVSVPPPQPRLHAAHSLGEGLLPFTSIHVRPMPRCCRPSRRMPIRRGVSPVPADTMPSHQAKKKNTKSVSRGAANTLPPNGDERCLASRSCTIAPGLAAGFRMRASIVSCFGRCTIGGGAAEGGNNQRIEET